MKMIDEADFDYAKFGYSEKDVGDGIVFSKMDINSTSKNIGFERGSYRIISVHNLYIFQSTLKQKVIKIFENTLDELLHKLKIKRTDKILVCGLGNGEIVADSFGVMACKEILATNNINSNLTKSKICCINPNVKAITGIDTFDIVFGIASKINAKLIILIDSLLTKNIQRLGHSFQLSTCGMTPGGAIGKGREISEKTTKIKCLSIGVPFMFDLTQKVGKSKKSIIVSPKDNYSMINLCAKIVGKAINNYFNPNLNSAEIDELKNNF